MPRLSELVEAFEIFMKYNPDQWLGGANWDEIYGPGVDDLDLLTEEDKKRLDELGWFIAEDRNIWMKFV
jgi:hypothetical protein